MGELNVMFKLCRVPTFIGICTAFLPVMIAKYVESGKWINAVLTFFSFGVAVGAILGAARQKWLWAWTTTLGAWAFLLFAVLLTWSVRLILRRNGKMYRKRY